MSLLKKLFVLAIMVLAGCSQQAPQAEDNCALMVEGDHTHYHVHGAEIAHDHSHESMKSLGHTHKHLHFHTTEIPVTKPKLDDR